MNWLEPLPRPEIAPGAKHLLKQKNLRLRQQANSNALPQCLSTRYEPAAIWNRAPSRPKKKRSGAWSVAWTFLRMTPRSGWAYSARCSGKCSRPANANNEAHKNCVGSWDVNESFDVEIPMHFPQPRPSCLLCRTTRPQLKLISSASFPRIKPAPSFPRPQSTQPILRPFNSSYDRKMG